MPNAPAPGPGGTMTFPLDDLPDGAVLRSVTAAPAEVAGRTGLRVQLTEAVTRDGVPGVDYIDMPTFVLLPVRFETGAIEVDVFSRLRPDAPDYARGFAGIVFHVTDDGDRFESVYLRPLNGLKESPAPPRDARALQYYAFPDWKFDRLRDEYPNGRYEAGADIGPGEWNRLRVEVDGIRVSAFVNGIPVLEVEAKPVCASGAIGLWVDIGTDACFSRLVVEHG